MIRFLPSRPPRPMGLLFPALALVLMAGCSHRKDVAKAPPPPLDDVVEIKVPELDGRGSYRFMMSDGERRMSADEFDAWMKANGIRVATGKAQSQSR